jgi:hypothetical protein
MNLNLEELGSLTDQQINILVADKLGIMWYIAPVDNEDDPWVWEFSDTVYDGARKSLMHYCDGEGITDIILNYGISLSFTEGSWLVGPMICQGSPWRLVCCSLLIGKKLVSNKEVGLCS